MKLFDFFKRKKTDEEDNDVDDDDDFPHTEVIEDDTEFTNESDVISESEIEDMPVSERNEDLSESAADFDDEDIPDFSDDEEGYDGADHETEGEEGGRSPMLFIFVGIVVLFVGVIGGAGFWFLGGSEDPAVKPMAKVQKSGTSVAMAIPPKNPQKNGGLNALSQNGLTPPEQNAAHSDAQTDSQGNGATSVNADVQSDLQATSATPVDDQNSGLSTITGAAGGASLNAVVGRSLPNTGQGLVVPSVTAVSYGVLPDQEKVIPLASAPDETLIQQVGDLPNPLPIIGPDGRLPWQVYARPFVNQTENPKVAIIVVGLGFSRAASMAAIKKLPGEVSLAFSPYAPDLNDWMIRGRLSGHEVFLELPMESKEFPAEDAGPLALNTGLQVEDNIKQLNQIMGKMTGYVGLLSVMGSKFNEAEGQLKPILMEIKKRGLMFIDGGGGRSRARRIAADIDLPKAFSNVYLDEPPSRSAMDQKLQGFDQLVRQQASGIAIVHAYPNTIERLLIWIRSMEDRKLTLVPASELANKQFVE